MTKKEAEPENKDRSIKIENASDAILGESLDNLKSLVIEFAEKRKNILLAGAPGVGKELFSDLYAAACNREKSSINMTGIPSNLIDSTLFGHVKGAFTDAKKDKDGLITKENAEDLCFFFDELGDIPINVQAKLLRFVQFGEIQKVGARELIQIENLKHLRIVAASNKPECIRDDLKDRFRCLRIPSLIERRHDIPHLLKCFIEGSDIKGSGITGITRYTLKGISDIEINYRYEWSYIHPFKGNIRELKKAIEVAIFLCKKRADTTLRSQDFPTFLWNHDVLEPGEEKVNELVDPSWMTPPKLLEYKKQYGSSIPYTDNSEIIKFPDLKIKSTPLPYHYFLKSLPVEVSREDLLINETRQLRIELQNIGKTISSANNKIPTPKSPLKNEITYDNTTPQRFDEQFYNHQARQKRTQKQILKKYNLKEGTVKQKLADARKRIEQKS